MTRLDFVKSSIFSFDNVRSKTYGQLTPLTPDELSSL